MATTREKCDSVSSKLFQLEARAFRRCGLLSSRTSVALILAAIAIAIGIFSLTGLSRIDEEDDIVKLYSHKDSRLRDELEDLENKFGGIQRQEATIHTSSSSNGNTATKLGLDSILSALEPLYKIDETNYCASFDDEVDPDAVDCSVLSDPTKNLYCSCETIAASPNQITVSWPGDSGKVDIVEPDLCEAPPVPLVLQPSDHISYGFHETKIVGSSYYKRVRDALIEQSAAVLTANELASFNAMTTSAIAAAEAKFLQLEQALHTDGNRSDPVGSGIQATGAAYVAFGVQLGLALNSAFNVNGLQNMFLTSLATTNQAALENAYNSASGTFDGAFVYATVAPSGAFVTSLTFAKIVGGGVAQGLMSTRFAFASKGNFFGHGYSEIAQCIATYTRNNRATIIASAYATALQGQRQVLNGASWDATGTTSAKAQADAVLTSSGRSALFTTTGQGAVLQGYVLGADEPWNTLTAAYVGNPGLTSARQAAFGIIATGGDLTSPEAAAQINAILSDAAATTAVLQAVGAMAQVGQNVTTGVITATLFEIAVPSFIMPDDVTINGQVRPLPRTWGIDRFPCTRATALDLFKEGDFDYPYRMKQLDRVSQYIYFYLFRLSYLDTDAQCVNSHLLYPTRDAVYVNTLTNSYLYQKDNFAAFDAAQTEYITQLAATQDSTTAAGAAVTAFVAAGGQYYDPDDPSTPVAFPTTNAELTGNLGKAIATAVGTMDSLTENLPAVAQRFFVFGYWYRPAYGTHSLSTGVYTTEEILGVFDSALKAADRSDLSAANCAVHNTDAVTLNGDEIKSCFQAWSSTFVPYQLSTGDVVFDDENLVAVNAQRTAMNNYNPDHKYFISTIENRLGRGTSSEEREDIHRAYELAYIFNLKPKWAKQSGSGFGGGDEFASQNIYFYTGRSTADVLDEAAELEVGLVIGGYVTMIAYAYIVFTNYRNAVHSHGLLAAASVVVIAFSTSASLGLSAWFGIQFTPISTNVIPFIALGIGIDDAFVLMTAYAREIAKGGELHDVIGRSLEDAGPSILFTSLVNFVAFATGSITPILVVQLFCQQMMVSVFLNFLFIIALLLPLTVVDGYRVTKGRAERPFWRGNIKNIQDDEADQDSRESVLAKFFGEYFGGFITNFWVKVSVIVAFLALFSVAAWSGFENNEVGLRISRVATDGTYQHDFSVLLEDKFQMFSAFVITNSETFDNPATQENVLHTVAELQSSVWVTDTYLVGGSYWLHTLLRDANADGSVTPLSSSEFYPAFANWLAALGVTSLPDLYCIDSVTGVEVSCYDIVGAFSTPAAAGSNANVKLVSTRGTFYQPNLKKTDDFLDAIESARGKVDWAVKSYSNYGNDPRYDSYVIGYIYILWEQYLHIERDLYFVIGMCLVGVFGATFLLQFSLSTSAILCALILMVGIEVYGLLPALDIELNAFSTTNLVLSLGMSIEFTSHIAHQFLAENGVDRNERIRKALRFMGAPMFHGAASSILAVLFISASKTPFLRDFYFLMFLMIIIIAFANGMLLLPSILSFIGAPPISAGEEVHPSKLYAADLEMEEKQTELDTATVNGDRRTSESVLV